MITKNKGKNKISDCSENIHPTVLNYHDTTIFGCEVNFLSNYMLLRSTSTQKCLLGTSSRGITKIRFSMPHQNCRERRKISCYSIFRTYNICLWCPDSIHKVCILTAIFMTKLFSEAISSIQSAKRVTLEGLIWPSKLPSIGPFVP